LAGAAGGGCWERPMFDDPFNNTSTWLALVPSVCLHPCCGPCNVEAHTP
jgi:hypothetical protein